MCYVSSWVDLAKFQMEGVQTKPGGDKTHISSAKFSEKISHVLTTRNFGAKMSRKYKISFALRKPCESLSNYENIVPKIRK